MMQGKISSLYWDVWPTAWGAMGAVASASGLRRIVLPHYQPKDLEQLLAWEHQGSIRDAKPFETFGQLSQAYFSARRVDFSAIACDMPAEGTLGGKVLRACRQIPYGSTRNYGYLAEQIGQPDAARAVAAALGKNSLPLVIPCHRVTYADGRLGGFSAPGGTALKQRMLDLEKRGS